MFTEENGSLIRINGIFAIDDDGEIEVGNVTECWLKDQIVAVLEKEKDNDVNAYVVDLSAGYIAR